eukprot:616302-Prorocentrum_lima.AAC.1
MPAAPGRCTDHVCSVRFCTPSPSTRTYQPTTRHRPYIQPHQSFQELVDLLSDPHAFFEAGVKLCQGMQRTASREREDIPCTCCTPEP